MRSYRTRTCLQELNELWSHKMLVRALHGVAAEHVGESRRLRADNTGWQCIRTPYQAFKTSSLSTLSVFIKHFFGEDDHGRRPNLV